MALSASFQKFGMKQPLLLCQRAYAVAVASSSVFKSFRTRPRRNPRIIPHAKVKAYKVRPWREPDLELEPYFTEHWLHYEMQMDALKQTFYYELYGRLLLPGELAHTALSKLANQTDILEDSAEAERSLKEIRRLNREWNTQSAEHRTAEMHTQLREMQGTRDRLQLEAELAEKSAVLSFQSQLKRELAEAANFIDESNLDAKIEDILDSPIVDFNFAIDPTGNVMKGGPQHPVEPQVPSSPEELFVRL